MTVIFGGAYQGKLDFALKHAKKQKSDICFCENGVDLSFDILGNFEEYLLHLVGEGESPVEVVREMLPRLEGKTVIVRDISCGVVPTDPVIRLWREEVGRTLVLLNNSAGEVYRLYCGISTKLK